MSPAPLPLSVRLGLLAFAALLAVPAAAQDVRATLRPAARHALESAPVPPRTLRRGTERIDAATGAVRALYRLDERADGGTPEARARSVLARHAKPLGLAGMDLRTARVVDGRFDAHVTLHQTIHGLDLDGAAVHVALSRDGTARQVTNGTHAEAARWARSHRLVDAVLTGAEAEAVVRRDVLAGPGTVVPGEAVALWRDDARDVRPAWRLAVHPHGQPVAWTVWIDAATGAVLRVAEDASHAAKAGGMTYAKPLASAESPRSLSFPHVSSLLVDGRGLVFDPDPLTTSGAPYGTAGFVDGGDVDTPELLAQQRDAALPGITAEGSGPYVLKGPYVEITGDASIGGTSFLPPGEANAFAFRYPRSDKRFEAVMAYHHLDAMQRYAQTLAVGRPILERPIRVNPHGLGSQDNSLFYPSTFAIAFGDGGVDDAEDADVLRHEYTHALLHDQAPGLFATTEGRALHEGYADYFAASFSRAAGDPRWRRVYTWDGNNGCWQGRTLDHTGAYSSTDRTRMAYPAAPGCTAFATIYQWGLLWATVLADLNEALGRDVMDRLVLGSMAYLGASTSGVPPFEAAAEALLAADRALYAAAHVPALETRLIARGMLPAERGPTLAHTPVSERGATSLPLVATVRPGASAIATVVASVQAVRLSDTLALAPVTLAREGTDQFRAVVDVPAGPLALRYTFTATDADGRTASLGPFEAYLRVVERTALLSRVVPGRLWQRFGTAWAAAPRSLTDGETPEAEVSSLSLVPLDLPQNAEALRLRLRHTVFLQDGAAARAMLTDTDGRSWQPLVPLGGYPRTFRAPGHPMDSTAVFALRDTATATFDLTPWAGRQVRVRFDLGLTRPLDFGEAWTIRDVSLLALTADAWFEVPRQNAVSTPFPNPFHGRTSFAVTVAEAAPVTVEVVDVLGRRVALLMDGQVADPGTYPLAFGGVAAGVYVVRVTIGGQTFTRSVVSGG